MTNTLRVRNLAQKVLWEQELSGQISDGHWENSSPNDHWKPWCDATIVVDPDHVGRDFSARRESYNFTSKDLLDVVGERMVDTVRTLTGDASYDEARMRADLRDLKTIIKQHQRHDLPVPPQPRTYKAKIFLEGWAQEVVAFVQLEDDPRAVEAIQKRERDQYMYQLKSLDKKVTDARAALEKLEAERAALREKLGLLV